MSIAISQDSMTAAMKVILDWHKANSPAYREVSLESKHKPLSLDDLRAIMFNLGDDSLYAMSDEELSQLLSEQEGFQQTAEGIKAKQLESIVSDNRSPTMVEKYPEGRPKDMQEMIERMKPA